MSFTALLKPLQLKSSKTWRVKTFQTRHRCCHSRTTWSGSSGKSRLRTLQITSWWPTRVSCQKKKEQYVVQSCKHRSRMMTRSSSHTTLVELKTWTSLSITKQRLNSIRTTSIRHCLTSCVQRTSWKKKKITELPRNRFNEWITLYWSIMTRWAMRLVLSRKKKFRDEYNQWNVTVQSLSNPRQNSM